MMIHPAGVCERSIFGRTGPEKRRICSRGSPAAGATIVTDTWPEACMERMISLLRDWINASETGRTLAQVVQQNIKLSLAQLRARSGGYAGAEPHAGLQLSVGSGDVFGLA